MPYAAMQSSLGHNSATTGTQFLRTAVPRPARSNLRITARQMRKTRVSVDIVQRIAQSARPQ